MIKTNSGRAIVFSNLDDGFVYKVFTDELMFLKEKFAYEHFPNLCAKLVMFDDMEMTFWQSLSENESIFANAYIDKIKTKIAGVIEE